MSKTHGARRALGTVISACAAWLSLPGGPTHAAEPSSTVEIDVRIGEDIAEADALHQWVDQEASTAIATLPDSVQRQGTVRISIEGRLYDYSVTLSPVRAGELVGDPRQWRCECSNEELLDELRLRVPPVAQRLELRVDDGEHESTSERASCPTPTTPEPTPTNSRGLGPAGVAGIAMISVGALGLAGGLAMRLAPEPELPDGVWIDHQRRTLRPASGLVIGAGAGVLLAGIVVVVLRDRVGRRRPSSTAVAPSFDGRGGLTLTFSRSF